MVVQIENPANKSMHYGDEVFAKNLSMPDKLPKKMLYSDREAEQRYNEIQADIFQKQKKAKPKEVVKFPMVLKILLGVGATLALLFKGKTIFNWAKDVLTR